MQRKLKSLRALNGFTQLDVASQLGISETSYKLKEEGYQDFKVREIKQLKSLFNLSPDEIGKMFFSDGE